MVSKIILATGIISSIVVIAIIVSVFTVPPTPLTCQAPFEIIDDQCLCPAWMHETILDDGSKSCIFDIITDEDWPDFCKEFPGECGPRP